MWLKYAVCTSPVESQERTICAPPLSRLDVASKILVNIARLSANKAQTQNFEFSAAIWSISDCSLRVKFSTLFKLLDFTRRLFAVCYECQKRFLAQYYYYNMYWWEDKNKKKMTQFLYFRKMSNVKWLFYKRCSQSRYVQNHHDHFMIRSFGIKI